MSVGWFIIMPSGVSLYFEIFLEYTIMFRSCFPLVQHKTRDCPNVLFPPPRGFRSSAKDTMCQILVWMAGRRCPATSFKILSYYFGFKLAFFYSNTSPLQSIFLLLYLSIYWSLIWDEFHFLQKFTESFYLKPVSLVLITAIFSLHRFPTAHTKSLPSATAQA